MDQTHLKNHSTQPSLTAVKTNDLNQTVLSEKDILELIYQDKWQYVKNCIVDSNDIANIFNTRVTENKDNFELLPLNQNDGIGRDLFDQKNRESWYMPEKYKQFDIENYILGLAETPKEKQRVELELTLFKSHAMIDVLKFLKYMVDTMRSNGIIWGVGRGSSVASYVLYLLGVHKVNSIKYDLDPTEFLR